MTSMNLLQMNLTARVPDQIIHIVAVRTRPFQNVRVLRASALDVQNVAHEMLIVLAN
jgi:hypothetical protein